MLFRSQTAVWAGLEAARENEYVIVMDSDLQDPPSAIREILKAFQEGADTVFMRRRTRADGFWKRVFAKAYYLIQSWMIEDKRFRNVGDFYGISPRARKALLKHTEYIKYVRGLVAQIGFNQRFVDYDRNERMAGKTHYSLSKMFSLGISGISGFSIKPLIWVVYFAFIATLLTLFGIIYILFLKFIQKVNLQPGWAFLSLSILSLSALQMISISSIAIYVARINQEVKRRPLYLNNSSEFER